MFWKHRTKPKTASGASATLSGRNYAKAVSKGSCSGRVAISTCAARRISTTDILQDIETPKPRAGQPFDVILPELTVTWFAVRFPRPAPAKAVPQALVRLLLERLGTRASHGF